MVAAGLPAWFVVLVVAALGFTIGFSKGGFAAVGAVLTPLLSLVVPTWPRPWVSCCRC